MATRHRIFYFNHDDHLRYQRINMIYMIPKERRKIRPNVEATVREFKRRTENGKLRVRGTFQTRLFAFSTAIAINFGRMALIDVEFHNSPNPSINNLIPVMNKKT